MFVSGWVVLSSSKNKELAFDLANHTISKENSERYFREVGEVPTNSLASHDIEHPPCRCACRGCCRRS